MRAKYALAATVLAAFVASGAGALAANSTVTLTVPVDVSSMPYIASVSVQCSLLETMDQQGTASGAAVNRVDKPLTNGEFHGTVSMPLTVNAGHLAVGYRCKLYLFPSDGTTGFVPVAPTDATSSTPKEQVAAPNAPLVTMVQGTFGATPMIRMPVQMTH